MNTWNGSKVMEDFVKIAEDKGLISSDLSPKDRKDYVGNATEDVEVITRYEPTKEYDVKNSEGLNDKTGKELIEKAHKKPVTVADSQGKGDTGETVSHLQLTPTICKLMDIPVPETMKKLPIV